MEVKAIADVTESGLYALRDTELVSTATVILKAAQANVAALAPFNVTSEEIADLESKINAFNSSIGGSEGGVASRKSANKSVREYLKKLMADLDEIDTMMNLVQRDEPDFCDEYFAARQVKATGIRHKPPTPPSQPPAPAK